MIRTWQDNLMIGITIVGVIVTTTVLMNQSSRRDVIQVRPGSTNSSSQTTSRRYSEPPLSPKETVQEYYDLAPTNRRAALELISEEWRTLEMRNRQNSGGSFWDTINQVEVYGLRTLRESSNKVDVRVWIKYDLKNETFSPCESLTFQVILDDKSNQWLLDSASDVRQENTCSL